MFLKKSSADDFFNEFEENLNKLNNSEEDLSQRRHMDAVAYIRGAAQLFKRAGLETEATELESVADTLHDEATAGLTSDKMLHNLEEKGWVFNADDGENK